MDGLKWKQLLVCFLTGASYICIFLIRKPVVVAKSDLEASYKFTKSQLGWLDTSLIIPYAFAQIFCGNLCEKYGVRTTIIMNLVISSLSICTFGYWTSPYILSVLLFFSGASQATLWPSCVKCLSEWFTKQQLPRMFGIMGSMIFSGGIMGTSLAVYLQKIYSPDLRMMFMIPSAICLVMAVIVYLFLKSPTEVNIHVHDMSTDTDATAKSKKKQMNFLDVWRINLVPEIAFTMFGIKLVRYCLYMWLPLYFIQNLHYDKTVAGYMSTSFEIGYVVGSPSLGYFIDKCLEGRIHRGVFASIIGSAFSLLMFQMTCFYGHWTNFICLFMTGAFQGGPDLMLTGALSVEVGKHENAESAVSGIVNGFGSVGTIVQGPLIALIVTTFGWGSSFYAMIGLTLFAAVAMGRATISHERSRINNVCGN